MAGLAPQASTGHRRAPIEPIAHSTVSSTSSAEGADGASGAGLEQRRGVWSAAWGGDDDAAGAKERVRGPLDREPATTDNTAVGSPADELGVSERLGILLDAQPQVVLGVVADSGHGRDSRGFVGPGKRTVVDG
jgi:hypothetical protein